MGLLDEISGLFSNTESLFQSSDQKSDRIYFFCLKKKENRRVYNYGTINSGN